MQRWSRDGPGIVSPPGVRPGVEVGGSLDELGVLFVFPPGPWNQRILMPVPFYHTSSFFFVVSVKTGCISSDTTFPIMVLRAAALLVVRANPAVPQRKTDRGWD